MRKSLWYYASRRIVSEMRRRKFRGPKNSLWSTWNPDGKKNYDNSGENPGRRSGVVFEWKEIDEFVRFKEL